MLAVTGLALTSTPQSLEARGVTARSGSAAFSSQAGCWSPSGPTMTNACPGAPAWHIPLILDGTFNGWYHATVTATAATTAGDVSCQLMSADKNGTFIMMTGFFPMPSFNGPSDRTLSVWVPGGGTAMIDCFVQQGSSVHAVNY
jgi:hypothetical protein